MRELSSPEENVHWFWQPVRAAGLYDLLCTKYKTVMHAMICALFERWH